MARPRQSDHIREQLLDQGIKLFLKQGYHGTGLKQIVDEIKVPKGSFYNYFQSKEQYASEVIERYTLMLMHLLDQSLSQTEDDPVTALRNTYRLVIKIVKEQGQEGCLVGNLCAELGNLSEVCQLSMERHVQSWKESVLQRIEEAQSQGLFREDLSADVLTDIFWNAWQGALLRMKIEGNTAQLEQTLDVMLDTLFK